MASTHFYDRLLKLTTMVLSILLLLQVPFFANNSTLLIVTSILIGLLSYNLIIRTIATWLYCRLTLRMNINLSQAKKLNNAFSPVFPGNRKWLPMTELRNVSDDQKYDAAIQILQKWEERMKAERSSLFSDTKNTPAHTKVLTGIMYLLVTYFLLAGFTNLPPANYVSAFYCRLFQTDSYYPFLNSLLLILPTVIIFSAIDKRIK